MVDLQAVLDGLGLVVVAQQQLAAAFVALALRLGRRGDHVVRGAAVVAGPAAAIRLTISPSEISMESTTSNLTPSFSRNSALSDRAGHSIQDIAVLAVALGQALFHNAQDHVVRNQFARIHEGLGLPAHGGAVLHGGTQDVTGRDGGDAQFPADDLSLGTLAGARGAQPG